MGLNREDRTKRPGLPPATGIRLDWNESPFGPSPAAVARVIAAAPTLNHYPRGLLEEVTEAVARSHGLEPECVLLTNGVDEAVDLVLAAYPVATAWFSDPGFDGYPDRARAAGRVHELIRLDPEWEPLTSPADLSGAALFLAQPGNPTGNMFGRSWIDAALSAAAITLLDITYLPFRDGTPEPDPGWSRSSNVVLFQSFSKAHGLAGLRAGALLAPAPLLDVLRTRRRFHTVDSIALSALAGALQDPAHTERLRRHVLTERPRYAAVLEAAPEVVAEVRPTQANFVLARCRDEDTAPQTVAALRRHGIWVKDCAPLGLPGWLRVTVGTAADREALSQALTVIASARPVPARAAPA
jgi:histidinol-phosphate aminotransferase